MKNGKIQDLPEQHFLAIQTPQGTKAIVKNISLSSNFSYYISYTDKSDSGIYTCVMSNGYGNATLTVTLTVSAGKLRQFSSTLLYLALLVYLFFCHESFKVSITFIFFMYLSKST